MKTMKTFFTALLLVCSFVSMSYSTSAVAADATFASVGVAIDNVLGLLTTAKEGVAGGAESTTMLKVMTAARQQSKEITGDNFGASLQFANDDLKRARRAVKEKKAKEVQLEKIDAAITAFEKLKSLKL